MINGKYWMLHDDAAILKIEQAALQLLARSGARIPNRTILDRLETAGCRVDRPAQRCYLPEKFVREAVLRLGGQAGQDVTIPSGWSPTLRLSHGGSYPHLLEWPSGRRRLASRQDVTDMAKMAHVLDEFVTAGKVLTCHEIDQRVEPLWSACMLAGITDKTIGGGEVFYPDCIEPLVRMGEVITGKSGSTSLVPGCDFFTAPLTLDPAQAACFVLKRKFRQANAPGTMPVAGMSAPVTIAGTVTVALAELLVGWAIGYVLDPTLPAGGVVCTGTLDFRTTTACFASPEAFLQNASVVNIARRLYGINVVAVNGYCDAKRPGLEAVFQKMLGLLSLPLGTGTRLQCDGLLSAGQDYSPVQHLLDAEINVAIARFWGHYEVSDETIALDLIEQVMAQEHTNFLNTDHTTHHFRAEQWYPRWLDRSAWQGTQWETEAEAKMLRRIDQYCRDAVARYEKPEIDRSKADELKRIFLAAEKQIIGRPITPLDG